MKFSESHVEDAALEWLSGLGYAVLHGPDISPDGPTPERISYDQVLLTVRLREALERLNPTPARRDAGGGATQGAADRDPLPDRGEPPPPPLSDRGCARRNPPRGRQHRRRCRLADRFRRCRRQ